MKKIYTLFFMIGLFIAWYISYQGFISTTYYKVMKPEFVNENVVYFNFKIESSVTLPFKTNINESAITESKYLQLPIESKIVESNIIESKNVNKIESQLPILLTLYYHYDNTGSPLSDSVVLPLLQSIQNSWLKCGVQIKMYESDNFKPQNNGINVRSIYAGESVNEIEKNFYIVWVKTNEFNGQAGVVGEQCKDCLENKDDLAISSYNIKLTKEYLNLNVLKHVLIHEFGHAIGLPHSNDKTDIMYPTLDKTGYPLLPSDNDIKNCQNVLSQVNLIRSQNNINSGE